MIPARVEKPRVEIWPADRVGLLQGGEIPRAGRHPPRRRIERSDQVGDEQRGTCRPAFDVIVVS